MAIGIFGGTFDPIHTGHIIVAQEVKFALSLKEFFFVPAGQPWLKMNRNVTDAHHRLNMLRIALHTASDFKISCCEVERKGPTYTIDTMKEFRRDYGGEPVYFIVGFDTLAELYLWKDAGELIEACNIVAMSRKYSGEIDFNKLEKDLPGISRRIKIVEVPGIDISSSKIRQRVKEGKPIKYMVPPGVDNYIIENRLYL